MNTVVIKSFGEYMEHIENYKNKFLFRGQANYQWDIVPSLFRNDSLVEKEIDTIRKSPFLIKINCYLAYLKCNIMVYQLD